MESLEIGFLPPGPSRPPNPLERTALSGRRRALPAAGFPPPWRLEPGMRDREIIQRIKDATDLAALVGQAVKLRRPGSAWVGLCPFHSERSPSFQVVAERGFYHCFGCGKHGDAFTWLMEREGLAFPEAMEQLARAAGIEVPRQRERPAAELDLEARLRLALEAAQAFYQRKLAESAKALDYLKGRGMTPAFIQEAGLGYAPDGWEALLNHLKAQGFSPEVAGAGRAGLAQRAGQPHRLPARPPGHPDPGRPGPGHRLRRQGLRRGPAQVPEHPGDPPVQQGPGAVRLPPGQGPAAGRRPGGGGLLRRPAAAPAGPEPGGGAPGHGAHRRPHAADRPVHQAGHPLLRRRRRRPAGHGEGPQAGPAPGLRRAAAAAAPGRGPRHLVHGPGRRGLPGADPPGAGLDQFHHQPGHGGQGPATDPGPHGRVQGTGGLPGLPAGQHRAARSCSAAWPTGWRSPFRNWTRRSRQGLRK